jgi:DNA-3-methyladenine glycosylase II
LIDQWDGTTYRRVIQLGARTIDVAVRQLGSAHAPELLVTATPPPRTQLERQQLRTLVERLLGLRVDLTDWYRLAAKHPRLRALAYAFRGMKPPRFPTMFEALVNGFACQQLSLEVGLELLNRLAALCSLGGRRAFDARYAFPTPGQVARIPAAHLRAIGLSGQKVRALLELARALDSGQLELESLSREDDSVVRERLLELRGVGRWTAEYTLLRGLGRLHVFPGDEVGARKRLARWLRRPAPLDYDGVGRAVARWQPYAGLMYFHLLLEGLSRSGAIASSSSSR